MFRKALLALDRSPFSEAAIPCVVDANPTSVVVLEILESVASILSREVPAFDVPPDIARQIGESERRAVEQHVETVAAQLRELGIKDVVTMTEHGRPGPEIVRVAKEEGCDLIVMSTHGRSGISRALLGSAAHYVVGHVENAAVLLVRPGVEHD